MTGGGALPQDRYYRGYRFSLYKGLVYIYYGTDQVDSTPGGFHAAEALVDSWMIAP